MIINKEKLLQYYYYFAVITSGVMAGFAGVLFTYLIHLVHNFLYLHKFSCGFSNLTHIAVILTPIEMIFTPAIGALIVVFLIRNFAPEAKGHGVPEVIYAIAHKDSKIRPQVAIIKAFASAVSLGSGGAGGMEGPIVQIGAALSSIHNYICKSLPAIDRSTLIACGVAGGYASGFNAPIAGILFTIELIIPKLTPRALLSVTISAIIAVMINHYHFDDHVFFMLKELKASDDNIVPYFIYIILGVLTGLLSTIFIYSLDYTENFFERFKYSQYLIHAGGMFVLGVITLLVVSYTGHYDAGYAIIGDVINNNNITLTLLIILLPIKIILTCLTLGTGGSGGVFSPGLFIGSALGGICYFLFLPYFPLLEGHMIELVIAAMAGVAGGTTAAVLTSAIMILEMTNQYQLIIPVLIVCVISNITRNSITPYTIYTIKLARKLDKKENSQLGL